MNHLVSTQKCKLNIVEIPFFHQVTEMKNTITHSAGGECPDMLHKNINYYCLWKDNIAISIIIKSMFASNLIWWSIFFRYEKC